MIPPLDAPCRRLPDARAFLLAERLLAAPPSGEVEGYAALHRAAAGLVPTDAFYVCLVRRAPDGLHFVYNCEGELFDTPEPFSLGEGPTSRVAKTGTPVVMVAPEHRDGLVLESFADPDTRSGSAVHWPLWIDACPRGLPDGVLSVQAYAGGAYEEAHLAAIEWLARRAEVALRRARAAEREQDRCAAAALAANRARAVEDVRRFVTVLHGLVELRHDPAALVAEIRRQQVALTAWAPGAPLATDAVSDALAKLSPRELEVLSYVARGLSNEEVAQALMCSPHTVNSHLKKVYRETPLRNRAEVAAAAARIGIARKGE